MGKGNVCTHNKCEGLFYIDNEDLLVYRYKDSDEPVLLKSIQGTGEIDDYVFDEHSTSENIDDVLKCLLQILQQNSIVLARAINGFLTLKMQ